MNYTEIQNIISTDIKNVFSHDDLKDSGAYSYFLKLDSTKEYFYAFRFRVDQNNNIIAVVIEPTSNEVVVRRLSLIENLLFLKDCFVNPLIQRYNKFNGKVVKICYCIMVQKAEYKEI